MPALLRVARRVQWSLSLVKREVARCFTSARSISIVGHRCERKYRIVCLHRDLNPQSQLSEGTRSPTLARGRPANKIERAIVFCYLVVARSHFQTRENQHCSLFHRNVFAVILMITMLLDPSLLARHGVMGFGIWTRAPNRSSCNGPLPPFSPVEKSKVRGKKVSESIPVVQKGAYGEAEVGPPSSWRDVEGYLT